MVTSVAIVFCPLEEGHRMFGALHTICTTPCTLIMNGPLLNFTCHQGWFQGWAKTFVAPQWVGGGSQHFWNPTLANSRHQRRNLRLPTPYLWGKTFKSTVTWPWMSKIKIMFKIHVKNWKPHRKPIYRVCNFPKTSKTTISLPELYKNEMMESPWHLTLEVILTFRLNL